MSDATVKDFNTLRRRYGENVKIYDRRRTSNKDDRFTVLYRGRVLGNGKTVLAAVRDAIARSEDRPHA